MEQFLSVSLCFPPSLQGSELSSWTTGHFTEEGFDIYQNFPELNNILWDAEDKGMVPKLTPNHHVPIPENFETNSSVMTLGGKNNLLGPIQKQSYRFPNTVQRFPSKTLFV